MDIQGLKDKILQLAIQGKLVEQRESDEPASLLVEKIKKEKEKLVQKKKIKKEKLLPKIAKEEIPFEIPKGWTVIRYGDIAQYRKGPFGSSITKSMFVPKSETTAKIYEQKNAIQKDINLGDYYITAEKFKELESFELQPGDIIVSCAGTIGETFIIPSDIEKGIINQALMKITLSQYVDKQFYLMYFNYILNTQITNVSKGSAIKNIPPLKHLKNIVFPLPSLQEQKRIVEKVDQLFTLADELDSNKGDLFETINLTRNKVLQKAIQGKLVEQNKNDEPAIILLEKIKKEKEKLVNEKKIRKEKPLPKITEDEIPFEIPQGWTVVRYGDIAQYKKGPFGSNITKSMFVLKSENTAKVYEQKNAIQKNINIGDYYITAEKFTELKSFELLPDDIIVSCAGTIGETFIMPKSMEKGIINQALMKITLTQYVDKQFYLMYFNYILNTQITNVSKGSAIKNIPPLKHLKNIIFPIPPFAEQKRIVEKVDIIMSMLDKLEHQLSAKTR